MRRSRWTAALVVGLAAPAAPAGAESTPTEPTEAWVVTLAAGADVDLDLDGTAIGPRDVVVEATVAQAAALAATPGIVAVEADEPAFGADLPPDPCVLGPGCPVVGNQGSLRRVGADTAWPVAHAAPGVVVAVIDGGVDATHPELSGRVAAVPPGPDGCLALPAVLGTTDRTASGHGTRVAGIIAAAGDGRGMVGLAWGGVSVRAYTALGPDLRGSTADVVAAIHCAIDDGARVINLSLVAGDTTAMRNALERAEAAGVVVVAAAGNGGDGGHPGPYPAAHPTVVAVTAVVAGMGDERRAAFANGGPWVDLGAPGTAVLSTVPGGWSVANGTSYAAPVVAATAAVVRARAPQLDAAGVRARLEATAEPLVDPTVGRGLVDVSAAVRFPIADAAPCATAPAWVLDGFGGLHPVGGAPTVQTAAYWPGWDIARDLATHPGVRGGYVLDGFGGLHAFGGARPLAAPAYHPGWDVARAADRRADGSVVVLDYQGGLHVAGRGPALGPGGPWWPEQDLARDVAVDPADPTRAYVLDAYGGVHVAGAGGSPPRVEATRYTPGRDLARRLVVVDPGRGYVLDAAGRLHPWALEGQALPPAVAAATATGTGRALAAAGDGRLLTLSASGAVVPTGDDPCVPSSPWPDLDLARAIAPAPPL